MSLKVAAERLTGGACYHMHEVFSRPKHPAWWSRVLDGELNLLDQILEGFDCALDWPMAAIWRDAADRYPDAPVLLSLRRDADEWWQSANKTVWAVMRGPRDIASEDWWQMTERLQARLASRWDEEGPAKEAYRAHLSEVRATISPDRLFEYRPGDGWEPLCRALDIQIPDEPFPHLNSRNAFSRRQDRNRESRR